MPIKPNEDFIPRNIENSGIQEILDEYSSVLEELVNFASVVAIWCTEEIQDEKLTPLHYSFRHIFELIDAISVLVKYSCIDPCKILLRSVLESILSIKYILEKDTEKRLKAFMTCLWHQDINDLRKMNPDDNMHNQFLALKRRDKYMRDIPLPEIPKEKVIENIEKLKDLLDSSEYRELEIEYQRLKRARCGRKPRWYSMHGGPANIEKLAEHFDLTLEYEFRYREWSELSHGFDIIRPNIVIDDRGIGKISQIRLPKDAFEITKMAMQYGEEIILPYIEYFVPKKIQEAKELYGKEIVPMRIKILQKNRILVR
jgi:hypothetical protein